MRLARHERDSSTCSRSSSEATAPVDHNSPAVCDDSSVGFDDDDDDNSSMLVVEGEEEYEQEQEEAGEILEVLALPSRPTGISTKRLI